MCDSPIMYLYEKYERKAQLKERNVQRVADENIIKYIYKGSCPALIYYFKPVSLSINELIEREVAYFTAINLLNGRFTAQTCQKILAKNYWRKVL